jgi:membrane protease YdiL (CAAX protease family)
MAIAVLRSTDGRVRSGWRFLIAIVLAFLSQLVVQTMFVPTTLVSVAATLSFLLVLVINIGIFVGLSRALDRAAQPLAYIGFSREVPAGRQIVVGLVYGAAMVSLAVLLLALGGPTTFQLQLTGPLIGAAAIQLVLFAIAALHEEVIFRGYPFQRLIESFGPAPAVVALSVLFALPHLTNPNSTIYAAFNTAAVGALFATAYVFTRSLWLVWGMHWGWNFVLAVVYGLNVSGFDTDGPVNGSAGGPAWLTGGNYGIEGGASGSMAILAGYVGLIWLLRQHALIGSPAPPPAAYLALPVAVSDGPDASS